MFRRTVLGLATALLFTLAAVAQNPSVDEIIANNVKALGGMDKIKAIKSVKISGNITAGDFKAPIVIINKRPENFRFELTFQGLTQVQAYDGKTGWEIDPFGGKKDPKLLSDEDLKDAQEQADFDGPLVDYKAKGNTVELAGKEPVEGTDAYKLKVTLKNGDVRYFYIDAEQWLVIKQESKKVIRGSERETEAVLGDYKEAGGVLFPYSVEQGIKGSQQRQKITLDKIEVNPAVDDSIFKFPAAAAAPKAEDKKPEEKKPETKK